MADTDTYPRIKPKHNARYTDRHILRTLCVIVCLIYGGYPRVSAECQAPRFSPRQASHIIWTVLCMYLSLQLREEQELLEPGTGGG